MLGGLVALGSPSPGTAAEPVPAATPVGWQTRATVDTRPMGFSAGVVRPNTLSPDGLSWGGTLPPRTHPEDRESVREPSVEPIGSMTAKATTSTSSSASVDAFQDPFGDRAVDDRSVANRSPGRSPLSPFANPAPPIPTMQDGVNEPNVLSLGAAAPAAAISELRHGKATSTANPPTSTSPSTNKGSAAKPESQEKLFKISYRPTRIDAGIPPHQTTLDLQNAFARIELLPELKDPDLGGMRPVPQFHAELPRRASVQTTTANNVTRAMTTASLTARTTEKANHKALLSAFREGEPVDPAQRVGLAQETYRVAGKREASAIPAKNSGVEGGIRLVAAIESADVSEQDGFQQIAEEVPPPKSEIDADELLDDMMDETKSDAKSDPFQDDEARLPADAGSKSKASEKPGDRRDSAKSNLGNDESNGDDSTGSKSNEDCKRIYNDQNCCDHDGECRKMLARLNSRSIRDISLDIAPPFDPMGTDAIESKRLKDKKLGGIPSRTFADRDGNTLANGKLVDIRDNTIVVQTEEGTQTPVRMSELGADEQCFVASWWNLPADCQNEKTQYELRDFSMITFTWTASALCHKPLYFEDVQLERYGHSFNPLVQPLMSGAHFFTSLALLPYNVGLARPTECQYDLGYYRPGNCAPWLMSAFPWSRRAVLSEIGAIGGLHGLLN